MGARWFGISPRVFNSLSHENINCYNLLVLSWTREEKLHDCKQPSYRHNRPSLRRKAYFSIKWKLRFHDPRKKIVKRVRDKAQDEKMRRTIIETDNERNFLFTKFSVVDFFLIDKEVFSCTRPKSACGKSPSCRFSFQQQEKPLLRSST